MIISAINAMTMTPARAAWIFAGRKPGMHGEQGKEALPWWSFALFGGLATAWLLAPTLGAWLGLPAGDEGGESAPGGLLATLLTWGIDLVALPPRRGRRGRSWLGRHPAGELGFGEVLWGLQLGV